MLRSSQPLTGTNGRRCKEDEKLINATLRSGRRGFVIDTRPLAVAQQARAKGGGFEQEVHYPQWRRIHKYIERWVKGSPLSSAVSGCTGNSMKYLLVWDELCVLVPGNRSVFLLWQNQDMWIIKGFLVWFLVFSNLLQVSTIRHLPVLFLFMTIFSHNPAFLYSLCPGRSRNLARKLLQGRVCSVAVTLILSRFVH